MPVTRVVLVLLAVLAMLTGPVAATAAQVACGRATTAPMAGMDMPGPPAAGVDTHKTSADPCCDHSGDHKMPNRTCIQACATTCAVSAGPPLSPTAATFVGTIARAAPATPTFVTAHEPPGLERPPKLIV